MQTPGGHDDTGHTKIYILRKTKLIVVELQAHAVVDFIVFQCDVILVHRVPLLDANLVWPCASLCSYQLFQITNGIILTVDMWCWLYARPGTRRSMQCNTYLHLILIFLPSLSLRTTSIMVLASTADLSLPKDYAQLLGDGWVKDG